MQATTQLLDLSKRATAHGDRLYLATIVHVQGSSYRKPGARMLVTSAGERSGTISGGCLEGEVSRRIAWLTTHGSCLRKYSSSFDDEEQGVPYGLGCGGTIWILMESGPAVLAVLKAIELALVEDQPSVIVVTLEGPEAGTAMITGGTSHTAFFSLEAGRQWSAERLQAMNEVGRAAMKEKRVIRSDDLTSAGVPAFVCLPVLPQPRLTVFGAGDDARPLVRFAAELGWRVRIADGRGHLLTRARFPEADTLQTLNYTVSTSDSGEGTRLIAELTFEATEAAVLLTHSYEQDRALLRELIPRETLYLGLLGPPHRTERLLADLSGYIGMAAEVALRRLNSPVGLNFGSDDPTVIALSIISELEATLLGASGRLERAH